MTAIRYPTVRYLPTAGYRLLQAVLSRGSLPAGILLIWLLVTPGVSAATLQRKTLAGWQKYVRLTEERVERELAQETWEDLEEVGGDKVKLVRMYTVDKRGRRVTADGGMIHHWKANVFIPGATLAEVLEFLQTYDQHHRFFREVEQSRLISREGDTFRIFYRLRKKKVVTAVYNTEHTVVYQLLGPRRACSRSVATRIAELEAPGTPAEKEKPPGKDRGFLWRANGYWRLAERQGRGVVIGWESISLSRSIPLGLGWLVKPFVESVPRSSAVDVLGSIRHNLKK